jgi:ABC-type multidrug transport system fused ATPase/permease subunit
MVNLSTWRKGWEFLDARERRNAWIVLLAIIMSALSAAVLVGSVMPFLAVLADPSRIAKTPVLAWAYDAIGFTSTYSFLVGLGLASFASILLSSLIQIVKTWLVARFAMMRMHSISQRLLTTYLAQPYAFFLDRHSGDMAPRVLAEAEQVVLRFFRPAAEFIASCLTTLAIFGLLFWVEPVIALMSFSVLGGIYCAIYLGTRRFLNQLGKGRFEANRKRFQMANESLAGIKDIKILGREMAYIDRFEVPSVKWAQTLVRIDVLTQVPQFAMQAIALGGILLVCLALIEPASVASEEILGGLLPVLGVFALGGQRLMPELSRLYQSLALINAGAASVNALHYDLVLRKGIVQLTKVPAEPIGLKQMLCLNDVTYNYPKSDQSSVRNVSLSIHSGEKIGIVGSTGAGKTTLADVVLGLLEPDRGHLVVDGIEITSENVGGWMRSLGYVPQDIFLMDAPVAENIALGVSPENIDVERIREVARIARIDHFIEDELQDGYQTYIGERGVRLSGGQRQRIGIARALYNNADVIIFDEATSALDNLTEAEVMEAIESLPGDKTVLMIAHRLSTLRSCDRIVVLDKGRVVGFDNWEALSTSNATFQRLALLN